jgi:hypothetical protein
VVKPAPLSADHAWNRAASCDIPVDTRITVATRVTSSEINTITSTETRATIVSGIPGRAAGDTGGVGSAAPGDSPSTQKRTSFYNNPVFSPDGTSLAFTHYLFFEVQLERSTVSGTNITPTVVSPEDFQNRTDWGPAPTS